MICPPSLCARDVRSRQKESIYPRLHASFFAITHNHILLVVLYNTSTYGSFTGRAQFWHRTTHTDTHTFQHAPVVCDPPSAARGTQLVRPEIGYKNHNGVAPAVNDEAYANTDAKRAYRLTSSLVSSRFQKSFFCDPLCSRISLQVRCLSFVSPMYSLQQYIRSIRLLLYCCALLR